MFKKSVHFEILCTNLPYTKQIQSLITHQSSVLLTLAQNKWLYSKLIGIPWGFCDYLAYH